MSDKMTAAKFRVIRNACGYTSHYIADVFGYNPRTADLWGAERGQVVSVPTGVEDYLIASCKKIITKAKAAIKKSKEDGHPIELTVYTNNDEYWIDYPDFKPMNEEDAHLAIPFTYHNAIAQYILMRSIEEGIDCRMNFVDRGEK